MQFGIHYCLQFTARGLQHNFLMLLRRGISYWLRLTTQFGRFLSTPNFYDSTIEKYASIPVKKLTLTQMLTIGRLALEDDAVLLKHARYVQTELPKRLARRLFDLRFLPHVIITNPHIKHVYDAYYKAFGIFLNLKEIKTHEQNEEFTQILKQLLDEQAPMLDILAAGLKECIVRKSLSEKIDLQPFIEGMLRSRISRRVIAQHHLGLQRDQQGFIGCVCTDLNVQDMILSTAAQSQSICRENYGNAPEIFITSSQSVSMPYVPVHLEYMLHELFKNSMRAVMEHNSKDCPSIHVKICESEYDVTIRISDEGGGIKPELLDEIWKYGFSTTNIENSVNSQSFLGSAPARSKLYGFGFGLPFSRLHAKYFGGDIQLISIPGFGVDTFLTTKKLHRQDWCEDRVDGSEKLVYTGIENQHNSTQTEQILDDRIFS